MKYALLALTLLSLHCLPARAGVQLLPPAVTPSDIVNVIEETAASSYSRITDVPVSSTNTVISPTSDVAVYRVDIGTLNTALSINTSNLTLAGRYATFEVEVLVPYAVKGFTLPSTNAVTYVNGLPDITTTVDGTRHYFVFRADETGLICNKWWTQVPTGVSTNRTLEDFVRLEQYGDMDIVPSDASWFEFSGGTITGFNWEAGREHVVIPYAIGGVPVTSIGAFALFDMDTGEGKPVVSVIAPKTVTLIGDSAFYGCGELTSISFPSATSIDTGAFAVCDALTTISLPSATSVGSGAFMGCVELTSITLGKTPPTWDAGTLSGVTTYVPHDATGYTNPWNGMTVVTLGE